MRTRLQSWAIGLWAVLLLASPPHAQAPNTAAPDPHGAVLCSWHIYLWIKELGDSCFPDEQTEFKLVLTEAVEKIEAFIMANGPATSVDIDRGRTQNKATFGRRLGACTALDKERYRSVESQGVSAIRSDIARLLAVPRKPVMNPCL